MLRRIISACCAASLLLLGAPTVRAAPPAGAAAPPTAPPTAVNEASERVEQAIHAWRKGEWTEVRDLLEPLVRDGDGIEDELLRESALRYLAEATLLDEGLDPSERRELVRGYIGRLLESAPDWSPPSGLHGRAFYDLVAQIRSERDAALAEACRGQLLACEADFTELEADHTVAKAAYADLETRFNAQDVAVTEIVKRNRGLALLPLGVGHFTNDNFALGGTFLALEVASGAAGLGLLIYRVSTLGCVRTAGFARKSLVCTVDVDEEERRRLEDHVETVRNAETVMGYLFLGSILIDVVLAQVLFKPITVVSREIKPRGELHEGLDGEAKPRTRRRRGVPQSPGAKLQLRPHPTYFPGGVGFGVTLQF
jgi:hypothetical protein